MATFNWRLGARTASTIRIMVHSDTGGVLSAVVGGTTFTGDTLIAEYPGKVDITGVSGSVTASLRLDGVEVTTATVSVIQNKDVYRIAWGSCASGPDIPAANAIIGRYAVDAFFSQGDMPYNNANHSDSYGSATTMATNQSEANMLNHHKRFLQSPSMQKLGREASYFYSPDDHEYVGDNWDNTRAQAFGTTATPLVTIFSNPPFDSSDANHTPPATQDAATAGNLEVVRDTCRNAIRAYSSTNPDSDDPDHFYWNWSVPSGSVEFFVLDCINYKSATARRSGQASDRDGRNHADHLVTEANATMLGATQLAWLKSALSASTATFKIIMSTKKTGTTTTNNGDNWGADGSATFEGYEYELENILAYIDTNSITGVLWCAGDKHYPHVTQFDATNGPAIGSGGKYDHACVCACPISLNTNGLGAVVQPGLMWGPHTHDGTTYDADAYSNFGLLEIFGHEYIDVSICTTGGKKAGTWRLYAGQNKFSDSTSRVQSIASSDM